MLRLPTFAVRAAVFALLLLTTAVHAGDERLLVVFGDSLSSGYRIDASKSWPALLEKQSQAAGSPVRVINASLKGETSEGGRKRLPDVLGKHRPSFVILALGANDGLRRKPLASLKKNLLDMVVMVRQSGGTPILVGMMLPPDVEPAYTQEFSAVFAQVAEQTGAPFVPFLLKEVVGHPELFLADRLHPNTEAQPKLLEVVWPVLHPALSPS
jgi:acyl-CoA thioesterase I